MTQLDRKSYPVVTDLIMDTVLGKRCNKEALLQQPLPKPAGKCMNFCGYWISQGDREPQEHGNYVITQSVADNLKDLARIVSAG